MALNLSRWRTHPQTMRFKAAFIRPAPVLERRVNQSVFTYPLAQVVYDNPDSGTGVYTDVREHMTLGVYDGTTGARKGLLRVRKAPTSTVLYINETSQGDVAFADNDRLVVYDDYRLWPRVPRMTTARVFYKDYDLACAGQPSKPRPIANAGPHLARDADPVTGVATVAFDGTKSFRLSEGISDDLTYQWDIADGTLVSGTLTSGILTASFPPGQRWVDLAVTDVWGHTARAVAAVIVCDEAAWPAVPVQVARLSGSVDTGWDCTVKVLAADVADLLPGTLMILYSDETYGDEDGPVQGVGGREGVKFVGWVTGEQASVEPYGDTLTVTARSPLGILQQLPAYSASLEYKVPGTQWHHMNPPTWFRALCYLLVWHSTLPLVCDVERPAFWTAYYFRAADFGGTTLYDQLKTEAERAWTRLTCDRAGRLYVRRTPHLMTDAERASLPVTVALEAGDWRQAVDIERRAFSPGGWLRGGGFTSHPTDPQLRLALAPGDSPGPGPGQRELNGMFITDQDELNVRLGHQYAWETLDTPHLRLTLAHQGLAVDPAWQEVVTLTLAAESNRRGIAYDGALFIPVSLEVTHDAQRGVTTEILTAEPLAEGAPATTQPVPDGDWEDSPWTPPPVVYDTYTPPPPASGEAPPLGLVYAATRTVIKRTRSYTSTPPTWETVYTPPVGWTVMEFKLGFLDPKNVAAAVITSSSQTKVVMTSNLDDATPIWSDRQTLGLRCYQAFLRNSHQFDQRTWFLGMVVSSEVYRCVHTHDGWDTVTDVEATAALRGINATAFDVSPNAVSLTDGRVYAGFWDDAGIAKLRLSEDYGGMFTISRTVKSSRYQPTWMAYPWWDNADENELWVGGGSGSAEDAWIYYTDDGGVIWEDRSPVYDGYTWGGGERDLDYFTGPSRCLITFVDNPDWVAVAAYRSVDKRGRTFPRLFTSLDRGLTWTHKGQFSHYVCALGGWPYDDQVLFATGTGRQQFSTDFGLTWTDKHWPGYADGIDTIPVWVP